MRTCEAAPQSECISATVSGSLSLTQTREQRMRKPTVDHTLAQTRTRTCSQSPANAHGFSCAVQHIIPLRCSQTTFLLFACHSPASVRILINMGEISGILFFCLSQSSQTRFVVLWCCESNRDKQCCTTKQRAVDSNSLCNKPH